jgi:hypothetical protein
VTGKARFRDRAQAQDALKVGKRCRIRAALSGGVSRRRELRAYRCAVCRGWHLTSWAQVPAADLRSDVEAVA